MRHVWPTCVANAAQEAKNRFLPKPAAEEPLSKFTANALKEDNPETPQRLQAVTRLADPSVQLVCLFGDQARPSLDAAGRHCMDLGAAPPPARVKDLLYRSLSVADRRLVGSLAKLDTPEGWAKNAMLRFHKPVVFDTSGRADVNGWLVELNPLLGLRILGRKGT